MIGNQQLIDGIRAWIECKKCGKKTSVEKNMFLVRAWAVRNGWWIDFFANVGVCKSCKNMGVDNESNEF